MKNRVSTSSLAAAALIVAIGLSACWDPATLNVTDLGLSDGSDASADATADEGVDTTGDAGPMPGACVPPLALCKAACTDTTRDPLNCGSCGNNCMALVPPGPTCIGAVAQASGPAICVAGACQFTPQTFDCDTVHRACANGACGDCAAGYQDKDLDGTCTPDCVTSALSCSGNGTCSDASGTAMCQCDPGFTGPTCATNIDDCAGAPCLNGGTCIDGIASYTCQCVGGFTGAACETAPSDLIVFASSVTTKGNIGNLAAADAICQGLATAKGLPGTFMALLSDGTTSAATRLGRPSGSYKLVTGTVVANTAGDLFSGTLLAPVDLDEAGVSIAGAEFWTGSDASGNATGSSCNNWTDATSGALGTEGVNAFTDGRWLNSYDQFCDRDGRLYCVQQ